MIIIILEAYYIQWIILTLKLQGSYGDTLHIFKEEIINEFTSRKSGKEYG